MALCMLNMGMSASIDSDLSSAQEEEHWLDVSESAWSGCNGIFLLSSLGTKTRAIGVNSRNLMVGTSSAHVDLG